MRFSGFPWDVSSATARTCLDRIGPLVGVEGIPGGNVSHVFRLRGQCGTLIVKMRGNRLARIPQLTTSPHFVAHEARALALLGPLMPGTFPDVITMDPARGVLVLSDLGSHCESLSERWSCSGASDEDAALLGQEVGRMHELAAALPDSIRPDGDVTIQRHLLGYCLREFRHPALLAAADRCLSGPSQLVHGDAAPKNFLAADGRLRICDLDGAHRGSRSFEVAYAAAHILLHSPPDQFAMTRVLESFTAAYREHQPQQRLDPADFTVPMVGVLLYRLLNPLIAYPLRHSDEQRRRISLKLLELLDTGRPSIRDVCKAILSADVHHGPAELRWR